MYGVIVIFNNFFHDLAAALWFSSWFLIYNLFKIVNNKKVFINKTFFLIFRRTINIAYLSLFFIVVGGIFRTINYSNYEYIPAAGRGQISLLLLKHFLFFLLVIIGFILQSKFYERLVSYKNQLEYEKPDELEEILKPYYFFLKVKSKISRFNYNNKNFVLLFFYIFLTSSVLFFVLSRSAISVPYERTKEDIYQYDLTVEKADFNLPVLKVFPVTNIHLLRYVKNPVLEVVVINSGQKDMNDVIFEVSIEDKAWKTFYKETKGLGGLKAGWKRKLIIEDLKLKQGTIKTLKVTVFADEKDGFPDDNQQEYRFVLSLAQSK